MNVLSPFDETVRDLTLAQHLPRIKKLLVYACTHQWENDARGLSSYHLHDLVQQLVQIAPTFSTLKTHFHSVIQTLNKPAEYTLIANTIVRHMEPLYPDAVSYASEQYQSLYRIAAQQLELDDDQARMKKLIYFVCRDQWSSDLETVNLHELIGELHALTPTYDELIAVLESVVQTISKPDKYRAIAQKIIQGTAPLYHPTTQALIHPEHHSPVAHPPQLPSTLTQADVSSPSPSTPSLSTPSLSTPSLSTPSLSTPSSPVTTESVVPPSAQKTPSKPISMRKKVASLSADDWFTLRIEIHKFTNPLLAKYLLLMNSYADAVGSHGDSPDQWDRMVWDALKSTDLDTLLCDGLKNYRNLGEFERGLKRTARQLQNSQQYNSVMGAISRAVRPTFSDCQEPAAIIYPPTADDAQGTPTYGRRRSLDGHPSQSLPSQPLVPYQASDQAFSEQETSIEPMPSPSTPVSGHPMELEPTESDSHVDETEVEPTSSADYPIEDSSSSGLSNGAWSNGTWSNGTWSNGTWSNGMTNRPMGGNDDETDFLGESSSGFNSGSNSSSRPSFKQDAELGVGLEPELEPELEPGPDADRHLLADMQLEHQRDANLIASDGETTPEETLFMPSS